MSGGAELAVIGAGPAGAGAALMAAGLGVDTVLIDEAPAAGGQVYRARPDGFRSPDAAAAGPDAATGDAIRRRLAASAVRQLFERRVWCVSPDYRIDAMGPSGPEQWQARAIIAATGTTERILPFPGWTTPGVIGLAAATILLKAQHMLPGESTLVAGCGPLLAAVAEAILKGGGKVAAVLDLAGRSEWLAALPALAARPDLAWRGLGWLATLRRAGVPVLSRHGIAEIRATPAGLEVAAVPVDAAGAPRAGAAARRFTADAVTVGHGLVPATELTRLLGARHVYDRERGGWIAERDGELRLSLPLLYAAGDGGGISGAAAAFLEGELAGLAAARDLGRLDAQRFDALARPRRVALGRARRFGGAMARLMALRPGQAAAVPAETVVCRCEDVTRGEIEAAIAEGAREVNQLKAWTRCGMGPCQGRICGDVAASLVASRLATDTSGEAYAAARRAAGIFTARAPLRPLDLAAVTGRYDYADIPLPKAAPL